MFTTDGRTDGIPTKKCSHFILMTAFFSWRISLRLIPEWLTIKSVIKESSFECPKHLIQFQLTFFFVGGLDPIVYTYIYSTLISGKIQCVFSISIRISLSARGGAMSNFSVLMFTSFALIHFKCQTPLTRAAPAIETQGVS